MRTIWCSSGCIAGQRARERGVHDAADGRRRDARLHLARTVDEARRMARHLQSLGFPKGATVAIVSKNCAHFILSELAIWMAGYVSVAIYPTVNTKTIRYILEHSEAKLLFVGKLDTWDQGAQARRAEGLPCISFPLSPKTDFPTWDDLIAKTEPIEGNPTREPDDRALMLYTSGSTGQPKGVVHTFRTITCSVKGGQAALHLQPTDRVLSYLPLAHVFERAWSSSRSRFTSASASSSPSR